MHRTPRRRSCKLSTTTAVIETEFEVDSNRVGQQWNVVIKDNGVTVFSGIAHDDLRRAVRSTSAGCIPNRAGTDTIVATAKNAATGESCVARASI